MTQEEGNKLIAEFMGYKYFESNVQTEDEWGRLKDLDVYSKVPVSIEIMEGGDKVTQLLPNPDFGKDGGKWRSDIKRLSWETINHGKYIVGELKYHTSWDWLMPVVEKIEKMGICDEIIINGKWCFIKCGADLFQSRAEISKMDGVYNNVIQFIQWYNQNPQ